MTTITREQAQSVSDLKAGYTLGHADVEILKELARIALASLTAEPEKCGHVNLDCDDGKAVEQLIEEAKQSIKACHTIMRVSPNIDAHKISLRLAEIALASLDAEPVYQYQSCIYNEDNGETDWYWDDCDIGFYEQYAADRRRILYTAPPAPVPMKDHQIRKLVNELRDIAVEYHGTQQLRERIARTIRAAMLNHSGRVTDMVEPVSQPYKLPPHVYRELVNQLHSTAMKYGGCQQLREQISRTLGTVLDPAHSHIK